MPPEGSFCALASSGKASQNELTKNAAAISEENRNLRFIEKSQFQIKDELLPFNEWLLFRSRPV